MDTKLQPWLTILSLLTIIPGITHILQLSELPCPLLRKRLGVVGYPSDDINKFLWMVHIGGGVFPHIKEPDYLRDGQYRIDAEATPTMLNCLMYKLSYYRFVETDGKGFDRVWRTEIGKKYFKLTHFEEALHHITGWSGFTS